LNIQMSQPDSLTSSLAQLVSADFLFSFNMQLLQTMNQIMQVQKQNLDGLSSMDPQKTQKLIGKIQSDPEIIRRLQQLGLAHGHPKINPSTPSPKNSPRESESSKRSLGDLEGSVFKKRKLNEESAKKEAQSPSNKSDGSTDSHDSHWSDFPKTPKLDFNEEESNSKITEKTNRKPWVTTIDPFSKTSAFSSFKLNRQAN